MKPHRNKIGRDDWRTPGWLFDKLDSVYQFTCDAAASDENRKNTYCYFSENSNALENEWTGERVFCNPPFTKKVQFIKKAIEEVESGRCPICVMILPLALDAKWFHELVKDRYHYEILKGRVSFLDNENKPVQGNTVGTLIVYFQKRIGQ